MRIDTAIDTHRILENARLSIENRWDKFLGKLGSYMSFVSLLGEHPPLAEIYFLFFAIFCNYFKSGVIKPINFGIARTRYFIPRMKWISKRV